MTTKNQSRLAIVAAAFGLAAVLAASPSMAAVYVEGASDCAMWQQTRSSDDGGALEGYALGMLNGLAIGTGREFWHAHGAAMTRDAAYEWLDGYCRRNPTEYLSTAVYRLFDSQAATSE